VRARRDEGVANHIGPEPCVSNGEASAGEERASRILTHIPANAAGVIGSCKLAACEDTVFFEASYQCVTGWVSGYYFASLR
jgi:hypothetical protein